MQAAFRERHGLQCGFCTPGMIMSAIDLVKRNPNPTEEDVRDVARGQHLPLHRLPQHRQGRAGRRREMRDAEADEPPRHRRLGQAQGGPPLHHRRAAATPTTSTARARPTPYFVRSPHAHARIKRRRQDRGAGARPACVAVLTGEDVAADKVGGLPCGWLIKSKDGSPMKAGPHPLAGPGQGALRRRPRRDGDRRDSSSRPRTAPSWSTVDYEGCRPRRPRRRATRRPATGPRRRARNLSTTGSSATGRRPTRHLPAPPTSPSSTSSTTG